MTSRRDIRARKKNLFSFNQKIICISSYKVFKSIGLQSPSDEETLKAISDKQSRVNSNKKTLSIKNKKDYRIKSKKIQIPLNYQVRSLTHTVFRRNLFQKFDREHYGWFRSVSCFLLFINGKLSFSFFNFKIERVSSNGFF